MFTMNCLNILPFKLMFEIDTHVLYFGLNAFSHGHIASLLGTSNCIQMVSYDI